MTGKERVTRAIEFKGPDKVPHQKRDYWFLIRIVDRCHESGMHCGMHSCGDSSHWFRS